MDKKELITEVKKNFTLNPCYLLGNQENKAKSMADRMETNSGGRYRMSAKIFFISILQCRRFYVCYKSEQV